MQGIFVNGRRPKSKKAVKEAVMDGLTQWEAARASYAGAGTSLPPP